jgi:hypothetical protein
MEFSIAARRKYYDHGAVQQRIAEFFGGQIPDSATAVFFAAGTDEASNHRHRLPLEDLQSWMRSGAELNRSLWDRRSLLAHLDIEYDHLPPGQGRIDWPRFTHLLTDNNFRGTIMLEIAGRGRRQHGRNSERNTASATLPSAPGMADRPIALIP